jgi:class 3 adenylate cyclase
VSPERLEDEMSESQVTVLLTPEVRQEETVRDTEQRLRSVHMITLCALGVSVLYTFNYSMLELWQFAGFNAVFVALYGALALLRRPSQGRIVGVTLIGLATIQLGGGALLFVPPDGGMQYYMMTVPVLGLLAIHKDDRAWWWLFSGLILAMIVWLEWSYDSFTPLYAAPMEGGVHPSWRAVAAFVTLVLIVSVFTTFHRDLQHARRELHASYALSESLLLNMLPASIADRLKSGQSTIADDFENASVLFADLVGFTELASSQTPSQTVEMLNEIFSAFDQAVADRDLEKIKTIGDAYMVASGVPTPRDDHVAEMLGLSMDMLALLRRHNEDKGTDLQLRIGLSCGPLIAGVIGSKKFIYDIWGDTVNVASRMESMGVSGRVQVTEAVVQAAGPAFAFEDRGLLEVKGKGEMRAFLLAEAAD